MSLLDAYERKARLTPGLLAFAPIAIVVATLGFKKFPAVASSLGVLSAAGGAYALSVLVAHLGRKAQEELWSMWGGAPTTRFLRMREATTNPTQREVWRTALEAATGLTLLSSAAEAANPTEADNTIEAAVAQVRSLGQDSRFPLVNSENIQYGFERNTFGIRWLGRIVAVGCAGILMSVLAANQFAHPRSFSDGALLAGIAIDLLFLVGWCLVPSSSRAKRASERYAQQLLQAVVRFERQGHP